MRFIKKISDRGTVTLPSDVREAMNVKEGDIVEFEIVAIVKKNVGEDGEPVPGERPTPTTAPSAVATGPTNSA